MFVNESDNAYGDGWAILKRNIITQFWASPLKYASLALSIGHVRYMRRGKERNVRLDCTLTYFLPPDPLCRFF